MLCIIREKRGRERVMVIALVKQPAVEQSKQQQHIIRRHNVRLAVAEEVLVYSNKATVRRRQQHITVKRVIQQSPRRLTAKSPPRQGVLTPSRKVTNVIQSHSLFLSIFTLLFDFFFFINLIEIGDIL